MASAIDPNLSILGSNATMSAFSDGPAFWGLSSNEGATFSDDPWEFVMLAGNKTPGICDVKGNTQIQVDKKKSKGRNGATITFCGYEPASFEIRCTVWTREQDVELTRLIQILWIQPRINPTAARQIFLGEKISSATLKKPLAYDVHHPALHKLGIYACVLVGVSIAEPGSVDGSKVTSFRCIQYIAPDPTNATVTVQGTKGAVAAQPIAMRPKSATPPKPSQDRKDLGPKGPKWAPGGGSD